MTNLYVDENRPVRGPYKSVCTWTCTDRYVSVQLGTYVDNVNVYQFERGREPTGWGSVQIGLYVEFFSKRAERSVVPER